MSTPQPTATAQPVATAPATPAARPTPAQDGPDAEPRWGSLGWTPASGAGSTGPVGSATPEEPTPHEPDEEPARHPYTWLHMIVLVVVAFILGMLIFMVIMEDDSPGTDTGAGQPQSVQTVDDGTDA